MENLEIQYEMYTITIKSNNLSTTANKTIIEISSGIEYIPIIITRYVNILPNETIIDKTKNCFKKDLSYDHIKNKYWIEKINNIPEKDPARKNILKWFENKTINQDYYLAVVYYSTTRLIIGIFILNIDLENMNIKYESLESFKQETCILLSSISSKQSSSSKYNMFLGILQYYKDLKNKINKTNETKNINVTKNTTLLDKQLNKIANITWKMIIMNSCNYIPKFELIIKEKKIKGFFQNHLNP